MMLPDDLLTRLLYPHGTRGAVVNPRNGTYWDGSGYIIPFANLPPEPLIKPLEYGALCDFVRRHAPFFANEDRFLRIFHDGRAWNAEVAERVHNLATARELLHVP